MAKELPYFRFTAAEWLNGDISLEATYLKGVFIDICAYYWFKDCSLTKVMLKKKYSRDVDAIKDLIELDILKHDEETDYLTINFLNEQYDLLSEQRKRRQNAGSKGGKQKSSNAKAELKQSPSYKDKDKYKEKDNYNEVIEIEEKEIAWTELNEKFRKFLCDKFGVSELNQPKNYFLITRAINIQKTNDKYEWFSGQCYFYFKYKEKAQEKTHGLKSFIGELDEIDKGNWNAENWDKKYQELKKQDITEPKSNVQPKSNHRIGSPVNVKDLMPKK